MFSSSGEERRLEHIPQCVGVKGSIPAAGRGVAAAGYDW